MFMVWMSTSACSAYNISSCLCSIWCTFYSSYINNQCHAILIVRSQDVHFAYRCSCTSTSELWSPYKLVDFANGSFYPQSVNTNSSGMYLSFILMIAFKIFIPEKFVNMHFCAVLRSESTFCWCYVMFFELCVYYTWSITVVPSWMDRKGLAWLHSFA